MLGILVYSSINYPSARAKKIQTMSTYFSNSLSGCLFANDI